MPSATPSSIVNPRASAARLLRAARDGFDAVAGRGHAFTHQPLGRNIDPNGVRGFYCDFRHKAEHMEAHPEAFPDTPSGAFGGHDAIPAAQSGLGYYELLVEGAPVEKQFLRHADWLVDCARPSASGEGITWYEDIPLPKYGLEPGWPSGLAQGEAIAVLLRAHALTGDASYLRTAREAFAPLTVDVRRGGLLRDFDGHPVIEEYPTERPCAILNGWILALFGVHELATVTGDAAAQDLFRASRDGVVALLPRYDLGWWSRYSLYDHGRPDLAKPFYQRLHPVLLDALALIEPDPRLTAMARRWERQTTPEATARAAVDKLAFRAYRHFRP